jgi:hypothetical protein
MDEFRIEYNDGQGSLILKGEGWRKYFEKEECICCDCTFKHTCKNVKPPCFQPVEEKITWETFSTKPEN